MAKGDLQIDTILLPDNGDLKYQPGFIQFEQKQRTVDNTLVSDFRAIKYKFAFSWGNPLDGIFMADLVELYLAGNDVTFIETNADLSTNTYICRLSISETTLREIASGNYAFSGFSMNLEEI
jgi:hypothetical protein